MFELLAEFAAFKHSLGSGAQSLVSVCTMASHTGTENTWAAMDVCYNVHGCCTPRPSDLSLDREVSPPSKQISMASPPTS
mmetsp:Transcript_36983/g.72201  ORF Transcript_36983/g.72201 Transcript_36983/m.72201 type:complete len:80 (+) Transcript_36983:222-461(+)